jgi:hypothetical protein
MCGKPLNETMIVQDGDIQSLRDELTMLRAELKEAMKGYNELTGLGIRLTREICELKNRAKEYDEKPTEKLPTIT